MASIDLALLGPPELRRDQKVITLPTRKAMALLAYLAAAESAQRREQLMALLWPDSNAELGRTSLRKTLAYLRQVLDDRTLVAEQDTLRLERTTLTADLWLLQDAARTLRQPPLATPGALNTLPSPHLQRLLLPLQQATRAYRSDFLTGFSLRDALDFDDWASLQREHWQRQAVHVFDRLAQVQFEIGDLPAALETAARWVTHDRFNEAAYRRLMQIQVAHGDRAAALQSYNTCRTLLERELGVEPEAETAALAQRIKQDKMTRWRGDKVIHPSSSLVTLPPPHPVTPSPFVGRAFEHLQLVNGYRAVQAGQMQVITLEGEPGIGKTRLAHEFLAWAGAQGAIIGQSRALEVGDRLPYQPLVEALRTLLAQGDAPPHLAPIWRHELTRLLPELAAEAHTLPAPALTNEAEARLRLFEALTRLVAALSERAPVLLFVDDLHWADSASLEVLHYAAQRWCAQAQPILLVLALRSEELAATPSLRDWLTALRRVTTVTRLTVSSLSLQDTQRLVQASGLAALTAPDPAPDTTPDAIQLFTRQLFVETGGQPFYIVELLRGLVEANLSAIERSTAQPYPLPHSVRELIEHRLARLSTAGQSCATVGALLGNGFRFEELCAVVDLPEATALTALEELLLRNLWREAATGDEPRYHFTHDRLREVAYGQLSAARRRLLHRKALAVLQKPGRPAATAGRLAYHAQAAGLADQALHFHCLAGAEAIRLFALGEAIRHYAQVQQLWESGGVARTAEQRQLVMQAHLRLGRAYDLDHQTALALAAYNTLGTLAQQAADTVMQCRALNGLATTQAHTYHNIDAAMLLLQEARQLAQTTNNLTGLAETTWNLAQLHFYTAQVRPALAYAEEALNLARTSEEPELLARTLNILGYLHAQVGQWAAADRCAEEALARYRTLGDQAMLVDCLALVSEAKLNLGEVQASLASAEAALALATELGNVWGETNGRFHIALALLDHGEPAAALAQAHQACHLARAHDLVTLLAVTHLVLGNVQRAQGDLVAAHATHLAAEQFNQRMTGTPFTMPIAAALCADCVAIGAWDEAYRWAAQAITVRADCLDLHAGFGFADLIAALLQQGAIDLARQEVQAFAHFAGESPRYHIPYRCALAQLTEAAGNKADAIYHWQAALTLAQRMGLPGEADKLQARLSRLHG